MDAAAKPTRKYLRRPRYEGRLLHYGAGVQQNPSHIPTFLTRAWAGISALFQRHCYNIATRLLLCACYPIVLARLGHPYQF